MNLDIGDSAWGVSVVSGDGAAIIEIAADTDIPQYVELARAAQAFLVSKGLRQWVPAAHAAFLPSVRAKVAMRSLHKVSHGEQRRYRLL